VNFLRRLALQGGGDFMTARVSMLFKLRALPDMLPFSLCNKKILAIVTMRVSLITFCITTFTSLKFAVYSGNSLPPFRGNLRQHLQVSRSPRTDSGFIDT